RSLSVVGQVSDLQFSAFLQFYSAPFCWSESEELLIYSHTCGKRQLVCVNFSQLGTFTHDIQRNICMAFRIAIADDHCRIHAYAFSAKSSSSKASCHREEVDYAVVLIDCNVSHLTVSRFTHLV
ncbi:hypothetical protein ADUPG1_002871, partial [Aduncisulcus paluster]